MLIPFPAYIIEVYKDNEWKIHTKLDYHKDNTDEKALLYIEDLKKYYPHRQYRLIKLQHIG